MSHRVRGMLSVEMNAGQMIEDIRLSVRDRIPVRWFGRFGGIVPEPNEIVNALKTELL